MKSIANDSLAASTIELTALVRTLTKALNDARRELRERLSAQVGRGGTRTFQSTHGRVALLLHHRRSVRASAVRALHESGEISRDELFAMSTFPLLQTECTLGPARFAAVAQTRSFSVLRIDAKLDLANVDVHRIVRDAQHGGGAPVSEVLRSAA